MFVRIHDVELSDNICVDAEIEFVCSSPGCPGDYWEPAEEPEFTVTECYVTEAWNGVGEECVWCNGRTALGDWAAVLDKRLAEIVDDLPDLYELQNDEYNYGDH